MNIYNHYVDYLVDDREHPYYKWPSYEEWLKQNGLKDTPTRRGEWVLAACSRALGGMYQIKFREWLEEQFEVIGYSPPLTDEQFKLAKEKLDEYKQQKKTIWALWLNEPGIHTFIVVPRQQKKFEAFLKKHQLTDKVIFKSKGLWNTHYRNANHELTLYIVEQK